MKYEPCRHCGGSGRQIDQAALGAELRLIRREACISLRLMAQTLGVSSAYLCDLELGRRSWHTPLLEKFKKIVSKHRLK